ncbi:MAG: hypothetical protein C5B50_14735 [Verrucomicrobia bacterium]|nr:MAG: hypothetical protein C5B50_14735 [Verrucomicrobiota bacterium]
MKLLFFSEDSSEVDQARQQLILVGIMCETRHSPEIQGLEPNPAAFELWIQRKQDSHKALMLCAELGIGFSRRPVRILTIEDLDEELLEAA